MKVKLRQIERDEEELPELPDSWIPVRLMHNEYEAPNRKAYTPYVLQRA